MKKFFALVLAVMLVMSLTVPAMAAGDYKLTINNTVAGHTYEAYQIFSGSLSTDGTTLSNVEWGASIDPAKAGDLLNALLNDEKNLTVTGGTTTLKAVFASAAAETDPQKKFDKMVELLGSVSNDSSTLDRFAEIVGEANYSTGVFTGHSYLAAAVDSDDFADSKYELDLPAGYYLIKDQEGSVTNEGDYYTKYIVRVVKSDTVTPKGSGVTVEKTINDTLGGSYGNYEDFDINDRVYYKLEGSIPTNLRAYDDYWYKFTDTLPNGVSFVTIEQIYIENHNGEVVHMFYDVNDSTKNTLPSYGADTPDDKTDDYSIKVTQGTAADDRKTVMVEFTDLLRLYPNLLSTDVVIVKYSCYLNRDALIKDPNTNTVYLEYDNNPNGEGHGQTVSDGAHAFTYKFTVDKYDMADSTKKLEGVTFHLYYRSTTSGTIKNVYAQVATEEDIYQVDADGNLLKDASDNYILRVAGSGDPNTAQVLINGNPLLPENLGIVYGWTEDVTMASILDTDANGALTVEGLDEGTYFLEELTTVDGYNKLDTPVQIDIIPTYTEIDDAVSVVVEYKVDSITQGDSSIVHVRNSKGSTLPSTGGMGTTLFYVLGSVLVMGALVMLITKKRMAAE